VGRHAAADDEDGNRHAPEGPRRLISPPPARRFSGRCPGDGSAQDAGRAGPMDWVGLGREQPLLAVVDGFRAGSRPRPSVGMLPGEATSRRSVPLVGAAARLAGWEPG
jgi:hypothetical protein